MNNFLDKDPLVNKLVNKIDESKGVLQTQWKNNDPSVTRHIIIDNFISEELCHTIFKDYVSLKQNFKVGKYLLKQNKKTLNNLDYVGLQTKNLYSALHSREFVSAIERVVGINKLHPDPTLYAGGLTMMNQGDYLNPHIDNSHDGIRKKYRRLNILFYITPDWSLNYGGNLELWNKDVSKSHCIISKFNRLVIMETNNVSWHSVSPVKVDAARCCLSTYYFTVESPENYEYFHVTSFQGRPEQKIVRLFSKFDNYLRKSISLLTQHGRR